MRLTTALFSTFVAMNATAMNLADVSVKCTTPEGKVTYQTGSCPPGNSIEVLRSESATARASNDSWQFYSSRDPMTHAASCTAMSPTFTVPAKRSYLSARLAVIYTSPATPVLLVRSASDNLIFHHNISNTGIQVGTAVMTNFSSRPSQTTLTLSPTSNNAVLATMQNAPAARVRVRIWPWDETYDSMEINLSGFKQAFALARQCAANL